MKDPGEEYYVEYAKKGHPNEVWKWRVAYLWTQADGLPVCTTSIEPLLPQIDLQGWLHPGARDRDLIASLRRVLQRVRGGSGTMEALDTLQDIMEYAYRDVTDPVRTLLALRYHMDKIRMSDLAWPILLSARGQVMDGRHRLAKAALDSIPSLRVQRFATTPLPTERHRYETWEGYLRGEYEVLA